MKPRILLLGSTGKLGQKIHRALSGINTSILLAPPHASLNVFDDVRLRSVIKTNEVNIVINCIAYTNLDKAEEEDRSLCRKLNSEFPATLANVCSTSKAKLLHFSTNHVFDGSSGKAYSEGDTPKPLSYYGMTKLRGESGVISRSKDHVVIRIGDIYDESPSSTLSSTLRSITTDTKIIGFLDRFVCPTSTEYIAKHIAAIMNRGAGVFQRMCGTYHLSCDGKASSHEFIEHIVRTLRIKYKIDKAVKVYPISYISDNRPAKRPVDAVMDTKRFYAETGLNSMRRGWRTELTEFINNNILPVK